MKSVHTFRGCFINFLGLCTILHVVFAHPYLSCSNETLKNADIAEFTAAENTSNAALAHQKSRSVNKTATCYLSKAEFEK